MDIRVIRSKDPLNKDKEFIKTFVICSVFILIGFILKFLVYIIGMKYIDISEKFYFDTDNEAFFNLGNEIFTVISILTVIFVFGKIICFVKNELLKIIRTDDVDSVKMSNKQSNILFAISVIACVIGFVLIVFSVILISIEGGSIINFLLVLAGIISEIIAAGFLIVYNKKMEQINLLHKLTIKKELYPFLLKETEKLQYNKERMMMKLIESMLKDFDEEI